MMMSSTTTTTEEEEVEEMKELTPPPAPPPPLPPQPPPSVVSIPTTITSDGAAGHGSGINGTYNNDNDKMINSPTPSQQQQSKQNHLQTIQCLVQNYGFTLDVANKAMKHFVTQKKEKASSNVEDIVNQCCDYIFDKRLAEDKGGVVFPIDPCIHVQQLCQCQSSSSSSSSDGDGGNIIPPLTQLLLSLPGMTAENNIFEIQCMYHSLQPNFDDIDNMCMVGASSTTSSTTTATTINEDHQNHNNHNSCPMGENWMCIECGQISCGRYINSHGLQHYYDLGPSRHCVAVSLADLSVWCYQCESYIKTDTDTDTGTVDDHPLKALVKKLEEMKFSNDDKNKYYNKQMSGEGSERSNMANSMATISMADEFVDELADAFVPIHIGDHSVGGDDNKDELPDAKTSIAITFGRLNDDDEDYDDDIDDDDDDYEDYPSNINNTATNAAPPRSIASSTRSTPTSIDSTVGNDAAAAASAEAEAEFKRLSSASSSKTQQRRPGLTRGRSSVRRNRDWDSEMSCSKRSRSCDSDSDSSSSSVHDLSSHHASFGSNVITDNIYYATTANSTTTTTTTTTNAATTTATTTITGFNTTTATTTAAAGSTTTFSTSVAAANDPMDNPIVSPTPVALPISMQAPQLQPLRVGGGGGYTPTTTASSTTAYDSTATSSEDDNSADSTQYPFGSLPTSLEDVAKFIRSKNCRRIIILAGAGMSVVSGIPDFRSANGLYATLDPDVLSCSQDDKDDIAEEPSVALNHDFFIRNPLPCLELNRSFVLGTHQQKWKATLAHRFVELLHSKFCRIGEEGEGEQQQEDDDDGNMNMGSIDDDNGDGIDDSNDKDGGGGKLVRFYSQNVDGLEYQCKKLPRSKVIHVHGSMDRAECVMCKAEGDFDEFCDIVRRQVKDITGTDPTAPTESSPIRCKVCSRDTMKPAITLFKSNLPRRFFELTPTDVLDVDLLIVIGTSLKVAPANMLVRRVPKTALRVVINRDPVGMNLGIKYGSDSVRDYFCGGEIDVSILDLMTHLGWLDDLKYLVDGQDNILPEMSAELLRERLEQHRG